MIPLNLHEGVLHHDTPSYFYTLLHFMKNILSLVFAGVLLSNAVHAQDATVKKLREDSKKTIKKDGEIPDGWSSKGLFNVNISQGSTSNWSAGADKFSFATNMLFNYQTFYKNGKNTWDNNLDVNYGMINTTSTGFRKNDDRIDFLTKYGRQIDTAGKWFFSVMGNFRTQLTDGYNYFKTAAGADTSEMISSFMAPATVLLSPGIEWRPNTALSVFVSPASSRWVLVTRNTGKYGPMQGLEPGKSARYELGGFLSATYDKEIATNFSYKGRLDLFTNYRNEPKNVDVFFTNMLALKVNKWLQVTYNFDLIYDDDALKPEGNHWGTQIKSMFGIGFATNL